MICFTSLFTCEVKLACTRCITTIGAVKILSACSGCSDAIGYSFVAAGDVAGCWCSRHGVRRAGIAIVAGSWAITVAGFARIDRAIATDERIAVPLAVKRMIPV